MSQDHEDGSFAWFLMGVVLGATLAVLYAPKPGRETRDLITGKAKEASDAVTETSKELVERGREVIDRSKQVVDDAASLLERARGLTRG